MPDTTWEPSEAKLEGGLVVFLERVGQRIVVTCPIEGIWSSDQMTSCIAGIAYHERDSQYSV